GTRLQVEEESKMSLELLRLAKLNLEDDNVAAFLVLLSNVYANAKSWKDVANMREKMVQLALKRLLGRSWAQINGSVHEL
nr:pentatricopeptide repeat-containing protein At5g66520-like [Tanacetum cinerariifolium]